MADITYNNHATVTSFGASDYIPFWQTSTGAAKKIGRSDLITSLKDTRVTTIASSATPQPNIGTTDTYIVTALAQNASILAPTGTPTDAQKVIIRIKDNGAARTLTWATAYRGIGQSLPSTTAAGKLMYMGFIYNSTDAKWDMVAYAQET